MLRGWAWLLTCVLYNWKSAATQSLPDTAWHGLGTGTVVFITSEIKSRKCNKEDRQVGSLSNSKTY